MSKSKGCGFGPRFCYHDPHTHPTPFVYPVDVFTGVLARLDQHLPLHGRPPGRAVAPGRPSHLPQRKLHSPDRLPHPGIPV